jgi:cellulose synthase/poly-beta-1,6-N-acetylglucosamine synthase-like glycosyltransferase
MLPQYPQTHRQEQPRGTWYQHACMLNLLTQGSVMLTIVITAYREESSIGRAIEGFLAQDLPHDCELLVVCPDDPTGAAAAAYAARDARVRWIRDEASGKPAALNLALGAACGELVILSDGDVYIGSGAVSALLAALEDPQVGIVSGRPVSLSPRDSVLGYWSHLLVDAAHHQRTLRAARGDFLECSGYLYAFRRALFSQIPEDSLAEDGLISHRIWQQGFRTAYAPEGLVYVKYPTTYADWLRQKTRSAGGYAQGYVQNSRGMRSFRSEALGGAWNALRFARGWRELWWTLLLFAARIHLWLRVGWNVKLRRRPFSTVWQRVDSTK